MRRVIQQDLAENVVNVDSVDESKLYIWKDSGGDFYKVSVFQKYDEPDIWFFSLFKEENFNDDNTEHTIYTSLKEAIISTFHLGGFVYEFNNLEEFIGEYQILK